MTGHLNQLLDKVAEAGASLSIHGDKLQVKTTRPMAPELVDELRAAKVGLLDHLRGDIWGVDDWWTFYEERCGIAEFDGELSRGDAEALAREDTITQWLHHHPPEASNSSLCAGCGHPIGEPGNDSVPVLAGDHGHVWLHNRCWRPWMARRREDAERTLAELGVGLATA